MTRVSVDVDGIAMSALVREVAHPRAVVLALHGGASTSVYWDCPGHPRLSLLRTGAALGFTVIALDRPGYGSSTGSGDDLDRPERRVELTYAAVDGLLASRPRGAGIFVVGHSMGCELVLRLAVDDRGADLLGVALAGTGREHHPTALGIIEGGHDPSSPTGRGALRRLLWEPPGLYPADVVGGAAIASRTPRYEGIVLDDWASHVFPALAARVSVPVHYTLGDHELVWRSDPAAVADVAGMFTAAERVAVHEQTGGGHNLSVGLTAMSYHLQVLSFVEDCVVARESGPQSRLSDAG